MRNFLLVSILTLPITATQFTTLPNITKPRNFIAFPGIDAANSDISYISTTLSGCPKICDWYPNCFGYVENSNDGFNCWFKKAIQNVGEQSGRTLQLPTQPARTYITQNNVSYDGMDWIKYRGPWSVCQQACDAMPGCAGYIIVKSEGNGCYLKTADAFADVRSGSNLGLTSYLISAIVKDPRAYISLSGINYFGEDITYVENAEFTSCATHCTATPACTAYTLNLDKRSGCWLKKDAANMQNNNFYNSYLFPGNPSRKYKLMNDTKFNGGNMGVFSSTLPDCAAVCDNSRGCVAYSHKDSSCSIKSSLAGFSFIVGTNTYLVVA